MSHFGKILAALSLSITSACAGQTQTTVADPQPSLSQFQPIVQVESGKVSGVDADGVVAFKGIPFAAPPVGDLRWRAPQPVASWEGIRPGDAYGPDCMQNYDAVPLPPGSSPAEDCLYLNVWRPSGAKEDLPVLVWVYGGGFLNGSASRLIYTGSRLALQDVVVVSVNYRLGRFGTFAHPALTDADADDGLLGNYGFLDQIAALEWVKRNVSEFGGDPSKITIMGESAGGMSVHNLLTSPLTQGKDLIHGAIIASGGNGEGIQVSSLQIAEDVGVSFAAEQGITADDPDAAEKLRSLPAEAIRGDLTINAVFDDGPKSYSSPFPDGKISVGIQEAYKSGKSYNVPIMIGATSGDLGGRDGSMVKGARDLAQIFAAQDMPTYYYRFSYIADAAEAPREDGAIHADDLPYYFDAIDIKYGSETTPMDTAMGRMIGTYVANFTKYGQPNGSTVPEWPAYSGPGGMMMDFSIEGSGDIAPDPWRIDAN